MISNNDVAIIGIGLRFPGDSSSPDKYWKNLLGSFNGIVDIPEERFSKNFSKVGMTPTCNKAGLVDWSEWMSFDPMFFGVNPKDVTEYDPLQRLSLKTVWEAMEDASIKPESIRGSKTSVFVGSTLLDYQYKERDENDFTLPKIFDVSSYAIPNIISHVFDLRGTSICVDTACSSALSAVTLGYQSLVDHKSDISVVGGVNFIMDPFNYANYNSIKALSDTGISRPFDADVDGFLRSEGVGFFILKRLSQAIQDQDQIYCIIKGYNTNSDAKNNKSNLNSPSKEAQSENIQMAIRSSNVNANDIVYFEAHGTSTPTGDPIESQSISNALHVTEDNRTYRKSHPILIGSHKSNIGHSESASGAAGLAKICLMMKHKTIVPNINFKKPNPNIKFDEWNLKVVTEVMTNVSLAPNKPMVMGINNFGIAGSNSCLILQEYIKDQYEEDEKESQDYLSPDQASNRSKEKEYLIPFSCNSKESLDKYFKLVQSNYNDCHNQLNFKDFVNYQITSKSQYLIQRMLVSAKSWKDLSLVENQKSTSQSNLQSNIQSTIKSSILVYVFCGQGPQWKDMGLKMSSQDELFNEILNEIDKKLSGYFGYSVLDKLRNSSDKDLNDPVLAQPSIFIIQASIQRYYKEKWGIKPDIVVGHSFGEVTAAYCSGMITLEMACEIIYQRSKLQSKTKSESLRMMSIGIGKEKFDTQFSKLYPNIEIACYNSMNSIVITGSMNELKNISEELKKQNVFAVFLGAPCAFHSSSQEIIKDQVYEVFKNLPKSKKPVIPIFSTVTSQLYGSDECQKYDAEYIYNNIREPVLFSQTIQNIYKYIESNELGSQVMFLEVAPHPTLAHYLKELVPNDSNYFYNTKSIHIISPMSKKSSMDELKQFNDSIGQMYCNGLNIDFNLQLLNEQQADPSSFKYKVGILPRYQWDEKFYFKESLSSAKYRLEGPPTSISGYLVPNTSLVTKKSLINIDKSPFSYLKGHIVNDRIYFPGFGYVDILLKHFYNQKNESTITINNLEFPAALILKGNTQHQIFTSIIPTSSTEYRVQFDFKQQDRTLHGAIGEVVTDISSKIPDKMDIQMLKTTKCNLTKVSPDELYNYIQIVCDLTYQNMFKRVVECYVGTDCTLSKIKLNPRATPDEDGFFDPSILDSTLHGSLALTSTFMKVIFERLEGLRAYPSNFPTRNERDEHSHLYVYSQSKGGKGNSLFTSITMLLEDGTVLIEIDKVVCTSLTQVKDPFQLKLPKESQVHVQVFQSLSFDNVPPLMGPKGSDELSSDHKIAHEYTCRLFKNSFTKREPRLTISEICNNSTEVLCQRYLSDKTRTKTLHLSGILNQFKKHPEYLKSTQDELDRLESFLPVNLVSLIKKNARIHAVTLFPIKDEVLEFEDTPQAIFEGDDLEHFYEPTNNCLIPQFEAIFKPLINQEKRVFRILEFGSGIGGLSLTLMKVLDKIIKSHGENYDKNKLEIEITFSDISSSFFTNLKKKLTPYQAAGISCIFKVIDISKDLHTQNINPCYYDLVTMSNVLHVTPVIKDSLNEIYKVLTPNGLLLFVELLPESIGTTFMFSMFDQFWDFKDSDLRVDHCCLLPSKWLNVLQDCGFTNQKASTPADNSTCCVLQAQKPPLTNQDLTKYPKGFIKPKCNNTIVFNNTKTEISKNFISSLMSEHSKYYYQSTTSSKIIECQDMKEFKEKSITLQDDDIIMFLSSLDKFNLDTFEKESFEIISIIQHLNGQNLKCKVALFTRDVYYKDVDFYLNSAILGNFKYYYLYNSYLYSVCIDSDTMKSSGKDEISRVIVQQLLDDNLCYRHEFLIKDNQVFVEFIKREDLTHLSTTTKNTKTFISHNEKDNSNLMGYVNEKLDVELIERKSKLSSNDIEIEVKAAGIIFKDNLIFRGIVKRGNEPNKPHRDNMLGHECSGIVIRVGDGVTKFKVGDQVFSAHYGSLATHIYANELRVFKKPESSTFEEISSVSTNYMSSYYSMIIGNIFLFPSKKKSILIHSAAGGVGHSALEILKWKKFNGHVFITVGNEEKEKYMLERYGDIITGVFSSRNSDFVRGIKEKLKELGSQETGVDLLINTLPSDFMSFNFDVLSNGGQIVDLSVTHIFKNELMSFSNFKESKRYSNIGFSWSPHVISDILTEISSGFESGQLKISPHKTYAFSDLKKAFEDIEDRNHIGKIVVSIDKDQIITEELMKQQNKKIIKQDYQISDSIGSSILVTGQTGLSLDIIQWLSFKSHSQLKNIVILSQSSMKWELELFIKKFNLQFPNRIQFIYRSVDVGCLKKLTECINEIYSTHKDLPLIDSIFHFAVTMRENQPQDVDISEIIDTHHGKSRGMFNLHEISLKLQFPLKTFALSSSSLGVMSSPTQCGYMSSCMVMDTFSRFRRSLNLPAVSTNWGFLKSGSSIRKKSTEMYLSGVCFAPVTKNRIFGTLDIILQDSNSSDHSNNNLIISGMNFSNISRSKLMQKFDYYFELVLSNSGNDSQNSDSNSNSSTGSVKDKITSTISELLSIPSTQLNYDIKLKDYGADSLFMVQLKNWLDKTFVNNMYNIAQIQNSTLSLLINQISNNYK